MPALTCWLAIAVVLSSCESSEPQRHMLRFEVRDDRARPLPGARVTVDGQRVGSTGASGDLRRSVQGSEGSLVSVAAQCPEGYREAQGPERVRLRIVHRADRPESRAALGVRWQCSPRNRTLALVVRTEQADLPVQVEGETRARTDDTGTAHVLLKRPPGSAVHVLLDTSRIPALRPRDPQRTYEVKDRDTIWLFEPSLERAPRARRQRTRRKKPAPYRLR